MPLFYKPQQAPIQTPSNITSFHQISEEFWKMPSAQTVLFQQATPPIQVDLSICCYGEDSIKEGLAPVRCHLKAELEPV